MLELAFLGVQPDGHTLTLNDEDGNRYSLPITDDLRAAMRRDRSVAKGDDEPKPLSPKDIQAHFRSGLTLEEVSDLTNMPVSSLAPYEYPIRAERSYMADRAKSFRIGHDIGGLTVEELVAARLTSRNVDSSTITWDAHKEVGGAWQLTATYPAGGRETSAKWDVNVETGSLQARNDEAVWLSETEIPAKDAPWRPVSSKRDDSPRSAPSPDNPAADAELVSMLDGLASRRGQQRPAPSMDEELPPAAHPPMSKPEDATDATVLSLPKRSQAKATEQEALVASATTPQQDESAQSASSPSAPSADSPEEAEQSDALFDAKPKPKPKKRSSSRPAMPAWDEIIFGHPKKDS